ncbi:unnamed protein product [Mesocestoides corti]|uniref:Uncharacterized protein n=2 Tax=Mesocestoides corti TaxID=53468 RepID=A0A0R3UJS9_MESCO|nr:unnamed protein product [Mesocestoides corti]
MVDVFASHGLQRIVVGVGLFDRSSPGKAGGICQNGLGKRSFVEAQVPERKETAGSSGKDGGFSEQPSLRDVGDYIKLKKFYAAALEACSIKDEEARQLRQKMSALIGEVEGITRLVATGARAHANTKVVQLLEHQEDLEMEKSVLQMRTQRLVNELENLRPLCKEYAAKACSQTLTNNPRSQYEEAVGKLRLKLELQHVASEVDKMRQELTLRDMEINSYKERMAQLREHSLQQEQLLTARTTELECCKSRELELRRSFAQRLQSLEMTLNASQCAFASREKELLRQLAAAEKRGQCLAANTK